MGGATSYGSWVPTDPAKSRSDLLDGSLDYANLKTLGGLKATPVDPNIVEERIDPKKIGELANDG